MQNTITINLAVDVIGALSDKSLENNIFVMDNSDFNSTGQGTNKLISLCCHGQKIIWKATAIDLQTPVSISNIQFINSKRKNDKHSVPHKFSPDQLEWAGIVPYHLIHKTEYKYEIELVMGHGINSRLSINSLSLMCI